MKSLKKAPVAILLAILIVLGSTLLSANLRFGAKCRSVQDGFYSGVTVDGYTQPGIASHLKNLCAYADGLVTIGANYDLDVDSVRDLNNILKSAISNPNISLTYLRYSFNMLVSDLRVLEDQLSRAELDERDASGLAQYSEKISGAISSIENSAYNDSVREFRLKYERFPVTLYESIGLVSFPSYF